MQLQGTRYVHSGRHETEKWVPEEAQGPVGLQMAGLPAASGQSADGSPSRLGAMVGLRDPTNRPKYLFFPKQLVQLKGPIYRF